MRRLSALLALTAATSFAQQPFTLQQVLSAPYSTNLTAAPVGSLFAWVEDVEGRHNLWVGGANTPARQLTHYTEDDAQDIAGLAWSPDGNTIAYVYGAETGNSGRPANPAHLQRPTAVEIILQPTDGTAPTILAEGHSPLFSPDGKSLVFLRAGQIFVADVAALKVCAVDKICHPERSLVAPSRDAVEGPATSPASPKDSVPFNHQLLYDRGTASQLTLSPDGTKLAYISRRRTHSYLALYDLTTHTLAFPAPSTGNDSAPIFSRDGKQVAWLRFPFTSDSEFSGARTSANPWSIQLLNVATGENRTLYSPEPNKPGSLEPRMSTGEPHLLWALANRIIFFSEQSGYLHPYIVSTAGGKPRDLFADLEQQMVEVEDAVVSKDGMSLIYASAGAFMNCVVGECDRNYPLTGASDIRTVWKVDIDRSKPHVFPLPLTPRDAIATHPVQLANGTIAALVSSAQYPMHPTILSSKPVSYMDEVIKPQPLHASFTPPTYPAKVMVEPKQVVFNAAGVEDNHLLIEPFSPTDLNHIHGQLFGASSIDLRPGRYQGIKHPAILFFHGGPKRQMLLGYPSMDYYSNAYAMNQYLASRGYIVLSVNYRGGIGYGLDFRQCQHCGADGAAEYADALGAVAYLRSRPDVDASRIGIWGGSYGGYFVGLALARNSDLFAAGVDFHGVHEWAREDNAAADWLRGSLAEQEKIAALAHASSPMADVDKWKSPVLLIHGDDDPDVAYTQTPMLADALRARGVHVEELIFPDELHGFVLHRDWLAAYTAAADFFDRTLKPKPLTGQIQ